MADKDLEAEDYIRFLEMKGMDPKCPLCKTDHWSVIAEKDGRSYGFVAADRAEPNVGDMKFSKVVILTCRNCGFVAPILRDKLVSDLGESNG